MDLRLMLLCVAGFLAAYQATSDDIFMCYLCQTNTYACIHDVTLLPETAQVHCNSTFQECYVDIQYLADGGAVNSISRSCAGTGLFRNMCIPDPIYKTCYSSCSGDLCNSDTNLDTKYATDAANCMRAGHMFFGPLWGMVVGGGVFLLSRMPV